MYKQILLYKNNLIQNYKYLTSLNKGIQISPVLKSNAYGHGILEIARLLDNLHPPFFSVNSLEEAYVLWKGNIKTRILIMGYVDPEDIKNVTLPFSYTIYNYQQLQAITEYQPNANVHIFIDTGMHREGFRLEKLPTLLEILKSKKSLKVEGLMSHLAYTNKKSKTISQLQQFQAALKMLEKNGFSVKWRHIFASAGLLNFAQDKKYNFSNLARVGKALYGIDPRGKNSYLKPILGFETKIVQVKKLARGKRIGYDGTFTTTNQTTIGIIPVGYADGLDRRLSNKGFVLIGDIPCKILGRISMNLTTVDLSSVEEARVELTVNVISHFANDINSIEEIAKICRTIPYDIAVKVNPFMIRRVVSEEKDI